MAIELPGYLADDLPASFDSTGVRSYVVLRQGITGGLGETLLADVGGVFVVLARASLLEKFAVVSCDGPPRLVGRGYQTRLLVRVGGSESSIRLSNMEQAEVASVLSGAGLAAEPEVEQSPAQLPALLPTALEPVSPFTPNVPAFEQAPSATQSSTPRGTAIAAMAAGVGVLVTGGVVSVVLLAGSEEQMPARRPTSSPPQVEQAELRGALSDPGSDPDKDGIPDQLDPMPDDANRPGAADHEAVYAIEGHNLHRYDLRTRKMARARLLPLELELTDIAIHENGAIFASTFDDLYIIAPDMLGPDLRGYHWRVGGLPGRVNALGFADGKLLAATLDGKWLELRVDLRTNRKLEVVELGRLGGGLRSDGDIAWVPAFGVVVAASRGDTGPHVLARVDPNSGSTLGVPVEISQEAPYGLAAVGLNVWVFDESGTITKVDPSNGDAKQLERFSRAYWGAAARPGTPP